MFEKLYIIGNGFDLHHGLRTKFSHFATYLQKNDYELYTTLNRYIKYPISDNDLWKNFEKNLADLDIYGLLDSEYHLLPKYDSEDFKDKDRYIFPDTIQLEYESLTDGLKSHFIDFIRKVKFKKNTYRRKISIDNKAFFFKL